MEASHVFSNLGAIITSGLGALGLFWPERAAALTSMSPIGANGLSEVRATYGGLFAAMGLACLYTQSDPVFFVVGLAWLGAGVGRIWSVAVDRNLDRKNLGGIAMELSIATLLLAPWMADVSS